jgi:hypothetical protein
MQRVLPRQVIDFLDHTFPDFSTNEAPLSGSEPLGRADHYEIDAILSLVSEIAPELIVLEWEDYVEFTVALHMLSDLRGQTHFTGAPSFGQINPFALLRRVLEKCPNEVPRPSTVELAFISPPSVREALRLDMSEAGEAFANGEWKAATVLAGAVMEALLLWALEKKNEADLAKALNTPTPPITVRTPKGVPTSPIKSTLVWGDLTLYLRVAKELKLITEETFNVAHGAKDFRNLIHPGRIKREERACSRGTAFVVLGAVDLVADDLAKKFPRRKK